MNSIFERIHFYNKHFKTSSSPGPAMYFESCNKDITSYINTYLKGSYIAPEAAPIATKTIKTVSKCSYSFQGHRVSIAFLSGQEDFARFQKLVHLVNTVLMIVDALNPTIINEPVTIYLFDLQFPKLIERNVELDYKHVNTGVTYRDTIVVYRREEMGKVLIHELIHRFGFELDRQDTKHTKDIFQFFGINYINVNEAYVDYLAMLINVAIYVQGNQLEFKKQWHKEVTHVYQQSLCIARIYHDLYSDKPDGFLIKEKTNTISYFIIKAMLYAAWGTNINVIRGEFDKTLMVYDAIISQFPITSVFWKKIQDLLRGSSKDLYSCRHGTSLRMSITDCI